MKKNTHSNFTVIILKDVFLTILFVCFSFFNLAHTQPLTNDTISKSLISRFSIESWTTEQGLPTNELVEIYQTTDGYLWISSHEGLIRFDGFKFEIYNTENTGIFPNNSFHSFSEDKDSTLWISSINGYFTYKNGNFAKSSPELENIANLKKETRDWLLMKNKETFFLDENTLHFPKLDTSIANIQLNAIIKDQSNNFYFGTSKGLFQLSDKEIKCFNKNTGLANDFITNFLMDDENVLWVSTISGLYYFDGFTFREDSSFKNIVIKNIVVDNNGDYWFTSTTGLYRKSIANNKVENISLVNKIGINDFSGIFIDSENNIWAQPLRGGLIRLKREKTTVFDMESDMQAKVVNAVHEYKPNEFLIAFEDGIIQIIKNGYTQNFKLNNSLKGNRVRHIFSDSDGNIWISTYKGLLKIDLLGREKWFNPQNGFPSNLIRFVYEDKQNNIWVGTSDAGLIKINTPQANKVVDQTTGLSSNFIMSIEEDKTGNLIVGTSGGGINRIRNDEVIEVIATKTGLISDIVFNTYIDTANIIWVVTNSGLSRISSDTIVNYNVNIGLSSNSPFSIKEDNKGSLWLPFPLGIMKINKAMLNDYAEGKKDTIICEVFDKYDGVPVEGNTPVAKSIKASNGKIWIPTLNGVLVVDPDDISYNQIPPPVHIESLFTDNTPVDLENKIIIAPVIQRITLNYTAICLQAPEKIRFKYKLEGYEKNWTETDYKIRSVSYTNLPYGNYTFKLQACNNDGVWNETGDSIKFYIMPFWYETILFKIIAILLSFLIVYLLFKIRIGELKRRQKRLETIVKERTTEITYQNKQLAELISTKDKFFGIIAHDLKSPFNTILGFADVIKDRINELDKQEIYKLVDYIHLSGINTFNLLENLLEWAQSQTGKIIFHSELFTLTELVNSVLRLSTSSAKAKNITIINEISSSIEIFADKNMIKTILRNLISNAIKFTNKNGSITINAIQRTDETEISVCDNGVGMDETTINKLFNISENVTSPGTENEKGTGIGLLLCKEFVTKHNGKIWVESKLGQGSCFKFIVNFN